MAVYNILNFMEDMALEFTVGRDQHYRFIHDSRVLSFAIQQQLFDDGAVFNGLLGQIHKTAAYVSNLNLDMPLNFDIFLPIRLPMGVVPSYNEKKRSVEFSRLSAQHPFFFGNAVNAKSMNLLLKQELQRAIAKLGCVGSCSGLVYDLKYSVWSLDRVPFVHKIEAMERGSNGQRLIRFDFVLALEFQGAEMILPPYFKAPIAHRWLAYGLMAQDGNAHPAEWAVLVPKWQDSNPGACMIALNCMVMLFRLLSAQQCGCFAQPASLKFAFVLATEERCNDFQRLTIAELVIEILYKQVFCNFNEAVSQSIKGDKATRTSRLMAIRKQQLRARGVYAMLEDAVIRNSITSDFVYAFFWYIKVLPTPDRIYHSLIEVRSTDCPLKRKRNST
ncbi:uncharacterized protein LOC128258451 isoform X1 [Drosophila gunungcola]|uniref:uncharacterized protein LOC128258451 isoform X1 n=2 Tax=Drosophila gunungcola TaxID=103775 RepID=UPI0022E7BFBB|nr:uncharacterized protein LOC128258451 isoform X1 [Drosophila gunungcola]